MSNCEGERRLHLLQLRARELAEPLRAYALAADRQQDLPPGALALPVMQVFNTMGIPPAYGGVGIDLGEGAPCYGTACLERVVAMEELARADVALCLAAPGPGLAAELVETLGDEAQKRRFYATFLGQQPAWGAFSLSEPAAGSDATRIQTTARPEGDKYVLTGEKYFCGNGGRAASLVIFANTDPQMSPFGIQAFLVPGEAPGLERRHLPTSGMRAARLTHLVLGDCRVDAADLLGRHLSGARRGLWGAMTTFLRMRPVVAALGLGLAVGALDYAKAHLGRRPTLRQYALLERLEAEVHGLRLLVRQAARHVDGGGTSPALSAMAKLRAAWLCEKTTQAAAHLLGPGSLALHPLLEKWQRDARGIEFMEGTTQIQKRTIAQSLTSS
jgi:acyl-CoA dehydrogenase